MQLTQPPTEKSTAAGAVAQRGQGASARLDAAWLRELCLESGADDVGLVEIDRPDLDDQRDDILTYFPRTRTLVSFVCRMNREPIRSPARSIANLEFHHTGEHVNEVSRKVVAALERRGVRVINPAVVFCGRY